MPDIFDVVAEKTPSKAGDIFDQVAAADQPKTPDIFDKVAGAGKLLSHAVLTPVQQQMMEGFNPQRHFSLMGREWDAGPYMSLPERIEQGFRGEGGIRDLAEQAFDKILGSGSAAAFKRQFPALDFAGNLGEEVIKAAGGLIEFGTSPAGMALPALHGVTGAAKAAEAAATGARAASAARAATAARAAEAGIGAGFSAEMAPGAFESVKEAVRNPTTRTIPKAAVDTAMTLLPLAGGKAAADKVKAQERATAEARKSQAERVLPPEEVAAQKAATMTNAELAQSMDVGGALQPAVRSEVLARKKSGKWDVSEAEAPRENRAERRASVEVPETGNTPAIEEQAAKPEAATAGHLDRVSQEVTGKPYGELVPEERGIVAGLVAEQRAKQKAAQVVQANPKAVEPSLEQKIADELKFGPVENLEPWQRQTIQAELERRTRPTAPEKGGPEAAGEPAEAAGAAGKTLPQRDIKESWDEGQKAAHEASIAAVEKDPEAILSRYMADENLTGNQRNVFNADDAAEVFPEYSKSNESRTTNRTAVHRAAAWLRDTAFRRKLAEPTGKPYVVFTAGGTGSGKSTGLSLLPSLKAKAQAVYDSTLADFDQAKTLIDESRNAGKKVAVVFTHRDVLDSLENGVLPRATEKGRTVGIGVHLASHRDSASTVLRLMEEYKGKDDVEFRFVDNSGERLREAGHEIAAPRDYNGVDERLSRIVTQAHSEGRISDLIYRHTAGREPEGIRGQVGRGNDRITPAGGRTAQSGATEPGAITRPRTKLDDLADEAQRRLDSALKGTTLSANPVGLIGDLAIVGARKLRDTAQAYSAWSKEMLAEYGPKIKPYLLRVWAEAKRLLRDESGEDRVTVPAVEKLLGKKQTATEPEGAGRTPKKTAVSEEVPAEPDGLVASPSFRKTKENIREHLAVSDTVASEVSRHIDSYEQRGHELRRITHEDIRKEAASLDPRLVWELDAKKMKRGVTLDPAIRFAARETLNGLGLEIVRKRKELVDYERSLDYDVAKGLDMEAAIQRMERDAEQLADVLVPTRSQDGRNLAYHAIMAKQSWDQEYWLSRARKAAGLPPGSRPSELPNNLATRVREAVAEGQAAENAAVSEIRGAGRKTPESARLTPAKRKLERRTVELTRDELVERAKRRAISNYRAEIEGRKGLLALTEEEKQLVRDDPEVAAWRDKVEEHRVNSRIPQTSDEKVADRIRQERARLSRLLEGGEAPESKLTAEEKLRVAADPVIRSLQDRLKNQAALRKWQGPVSPEMRVERGVANTIAGIEDKAAIAEGTKQAPPESQWKLSPEEKERVAKDSRVIEARRKLARLLQEADKSSWLDTITSVWKAGLLTGVKTHLRNISGNTGFQALEEVSRIPAAVVDIGISIVTGERSLQGADLSAVGHAAKEAATRGVREAREIMKHGATLEQIGNMEIPRELNSGHKAIDTYVNTIFRSLAAEDRVYRTYAYERALREQMDLAKLDKPTAAMQAEALAYSEFATFNNKNTVAQAWSRAKAASPPSVRAVMDFVVPFVNTPANVFARMVDYTPLGTAGKSLSIALESSRTGKFSLQQQRALSLAIGRGAVGSALILAGYYAAQNGDATGIRAGDREMRAVKEAAGQQNGSVRIDGKWHQISSLSPGGNLFTLGASLAEEAKSIAARPSKSSQALGAAGIASRTVLEQPMLRGLSSFFEAAQDPQRFAGAFASSQIGSVIPTAVGDVATAIDPRRREARGDLLGRLKSKVPGTAQTLPERVDVFGRPLEGNRANAVNPFLSQNAKDDPVVNALLKFQVPVHTVQSRQGANEKDPEVRLRGILTGRVIHERLREAVESGDYQSSADAESKRLELSRVVLKARAEVNQKLKAREYNQASSGEKAYILMELLAER